jgi:aspartate racemase
MAPLKSIGILGGMGPEASADVYMKVVRWFQKERGAKVDGDFPRMHLLSVPLPDILMSTEHEREATNVLVESARTLEMGGADFIVIACNSVHAFLPKLRSAVSIPIFDIAGVAAAEAAERGYTRVGLLATDVTLAQHVYDAAFNARGISFLTPEPNQQRAIMSIIFAVLAGTVGESEREALGTISSSLIEQGAQAVVLACTELPLVVSAMSTDGVAYVDCNASLAKAAAQASLGV